VKLPDIFRLLGGLGISLESLVQAVLHHLTPKLAEPALAKALGRAATPALQRIGKRCRAAGDRLLQAEPDRAGAARELAGVFGEIKF